MAAELALQGMMSLFTPERPRVETEPSLDNELNSRQPSPDSADATARRRAMTTAGQA
jgi:hypothetical protein